jgi:hypothetical protein
MQSGNRERLHSCLHGRRIPDAGPIDRYDLMLGVLVLPSTSTTSSSTSSSLEQLLELCILAQYLVQLKTVVLQYQFFYYGRLRLSDYDETLP